MAHLLRTVAHTSISHVWLRGYLKSMSFGKGVCKEDDKVADVITPILDLAYFIIIIWGSVKVFSKLDK